MVYGARVGGMVLAMALGSTTGIDNGLGRSPPMGWRSWNLYRDHVDQRLLEGVMRGLAVRRRLVDGVPTSLCDLGYCDVGLDDAWQACASGSAKFRYHDVAGRPIVNSHRFPDMLSMTETAHALGLTAGWYLNNCICSEQTVATHDMYAQDVHYLVEVFKFDSVKLDGCGKQLDLDLWASLINQTGRRIMIENCHWGQTVPTKTWCPWNFFRTSEDITPTYASVVANLQTTITWAREGLSRPGCWAYPDMLEAGVAGLNAAEMRSHFGAWCIVSSPLTLSHDVNNDAVADFVWPVISNKEAIAINQAWAGHSGSPFKQSPRLITLSKKDVKGARVDVRVPSWQFFYKPLPGGRVAVFLMNHAGWVEDFVLNAHEVPNFHCRPCSVRDVWARRDRPDFQAGLLRVRVASRDSAFFVLSPVASAPRALYT